MDLTGIKLIEDLQLEGKRVFIRCDFNVPQDDSGKITDDARIRAALPTIKRAMEQGAHVILASHLGRPKGKPTPAYSMVPVGERLAELLEVEVIVPDDCIGDNAERLIAGIKPEKQVVLLENLRFHAGEEKNDPEFAHQLARLAEIYINDAFGTAHRAHASVYGMVKAFDRGNKAAGYLMQSELENLGFLLDRPPRPFVAIMGGAKVSDKLAVLHALIERVDSLVIGGAMAYTFLKAQGHDVGSSRVEADLIQAATQILEKARAKKIAVYLPTDHVIADSLDAPRGTITSGKEIPAGMMGLDIGPHTRDLYAGVIAGAASVFWNGPMGVFEKEPFSHGTFAIARALAESKAKSVVGGGDSASAVKEAGVEDKITHVSTGGGASLELVEGRVLPGIEALRANHPFNLA
jgi:phosphoglycerate kinase